MKYNDLKVEKNTRPSRKGRGISAGQGKTAGRGTKGQKARTGHSKMPLGFMGGQRAIMQAVPKLKGFKSFHPKAEVIYTDRLNDLKGKVDNYTLAEASLISSPFVKVKVITRGELTAKTFTNSITYGELTCSLSVEVQRGAYIAPDDIEYVIDEET